MSRALRDLGFQEGDERAKNVATPFHKWALASTRSKLGSGVVSLDMLNRARGTLGIDIVEARDMHVGAFGREVRLCLGLPEEEEDDNDTDEYDRHQDKRFDDADNVRKKLEAMKVAEGAREVEDMLGIKFAEGAHNTLSKIQDVLVHSNKDCGYEILAATVEFWRSTALLALEDVIAGTKTPAKA